MRGRTWIALLVVFYPLTLFGLTLTGSLVGRRDRFSALASGLIVFLVLWLYALPRDLAWEFGPVDWQSRFVLPLTAYLAGLAVATALMSWTKPDPN